MLVRAAKPINENQCLNIAFLTNLKYREMYCVRETSHTKPFGFNFNVDGTEFENKNSNHCVIVWCIVGHNGDNLEYNACSLAAM